MSGVRVRPGKVTEVSEDNPLHDFIAQKELSSLPDIEIFNDNIPSRMIPYPQGSKISYKPYTVGDLEYLAQSKLSPKEKFKYILKGIKTSFNPLDLTFYDFVFLSMLRRLSSFDSNKLNMSHKCRSCGEVVKKTIDLNQVEFTDLFENVPKEFEDPKLPIVLDLDGNELHFGPLTIDDYFFLMDKGLLDVENSFFADRNHMLAKMCSNKDFDSVLRLIKNAHGKYDEVFDMITNMLAHPIKNIDMKCEECEYVNQVDINGGTVLIEPFREHVNSTTIPIRFGLKDGN
jgi:hypothetical protein